MEMLPAVISELLWNDTGKVLPEQNMWVLACWDDMWLIPDVVFCEGGEDSWQTNDGVKVPEPAYWAYFSLPQALANKLEMEGDDSVQATEPAQA